MEGLSKTTGFPIVCSKAVFEAVGSPADFKPLGKKTIKGRSDIEVYGVNAP
jgi:hypothetical protein